MQELILQGQKKTTIELDIRKIEDISFPVLTDMKSTTSTADDNNYDDNNNNNDINKEGTKNKKQKSDVVQIIDSFVNGKHINDLLRNPVEFKVYVDIKLINPLHVYYESLSIFKN